MPAAAPRPHPTLSADDVLAVVCVVLWLAAAAASGWVGAWPAVGGGSVLLGLVVVATGRPGTRAWVRPPRHGVLLGAGIGLAMASATYLAYPVVVTVAPFAERDVAELIAAFRVVSVPFAALALLPVVAGEELVWRGLVQDALMRRLGRWGGAYAAALLYASVVALLGSVLLALVALACGLGWSILRTATGSIVPSFLAHLTWNGLILLAWPIDRLSTL